MKGLTKKKKEEGFTLIEVMITMFFLTFIVQGLAMVSLYAQRTGIYARRLTSANILAEQSLERYRNTDYDNLPTFDGSTDCYDAQMNLLGSCGGSTVVFTHTTSVAVDTPLSNSTQVDVSVTWDEGLAWNANLAADGSYQAKVSSYISKF